MLNFETYYHIYNHANGNDNLFVEDKNYKFFLEKYYLHLNPVVDTIAWCLMPNHFHLLVKIKSEDEIYSAFPKFQTLENLELKSNFISKQFSNFFSSYTQSFNKVYKRRGSLFLKNFKRKEIDSEDYLRNLIIYIHLNPINHGFTKLINDWKWHSYKEFIIFYEEMLTHLFTSKENYEYLHLSKSNNFKEYDKIEMDIL